MCSAGVAVTAAATMAMRRPIMTAMLRIRSPISLIATTSNTWMQPNTFVRSFATNMRGPMMTRTWNTTPITTATTSMPMATTMMTATMMATGCPAPFAVGGQRRLLSRLKQKKLKYPLVIFRRRPRRPQRRSPYSRQKLKNRQAAVDRWLVLPKGNFARRGAGGHRFWATSARRKRQQHFHLAHGWQRRRLRKLMPYFRRRYMQHGPSRDPLAPGYLQQRERSRARALSLRKTQCP